MNSMFPSFFHVKIFPHVLTHAHHSTMALRLAVRQSGTACNGVARIFTPKLLHSRRNASAMAVQTESLAEESKIDYLVSLLPHR